MSLSLAKLIKRSPSIQSLLGHPEKMKRIQNLKDKTKPSYPEGATEQMKNFYKMTTENINKENKWQRLKGMEDKLEKDTRGSRILAILGLGGAVGLENIFERDGK